MSLEALRALRHAGKRPAAPVWVLVGRKPKWLDDDASVIVVREADQPALMDWRPALSLAVAVFTTSPNAALTLAVLTALEGAGAKFFGAADNTGTYPMLEGADDRHHQVLRQAWESLCKS